MKDEIATGARAGVAYCSQLLAEQWLGGAAEADPNELQAIVRLQVGLSDGHRALGTHLGEAESIFFAEKTGGILATDDNAAYAFARRRPLLGPDRVIDSIAILRNTVRNKAISAQQAVEIANSIEAAGRHFRPEYRDERGAAYFE